MIELQEMYPLTEYHTCRESNQKLFSGFGNWKRTCRPHSFWHVLRNDAFGMKRSQNTVIFIEYSSNWCMMVTGAASEYASDTATIVIEIVTSKFVQRAKRFLIHSHLVKTKSMGRKGQNRFHINIQLKVSDSSVRFCHITVAG